MWDEKVRHLALDDRNWCKQVFRVRVHSNPALVSAEINAFLHGCRTMDVGGRDLGGASFHGPTFIKHPYYFTKELCLCLAVSWALLFCFYLGVLWMGTKDFVFWIRCALRRHKFLPLYLYMPMWQCTLTALFLDKFWKSY